MWYQVLGTKYLVLCSTQLNFICFSLVRYLSNISFHGLPYKKEPFVRSRFAALHADTTQNVVQGGEEQGPLAFPLALVPCLCDLHRTQDVVDHSFDLGWRRDRHVVWRRKLNLNVEPLASEQSA